uniref:GRB2 associated binding protein 2 n=1 Tax=Erpetoichthys calabaricus TaxID=27687 RepID=A0A8C4SF37_ERPCA
KILHKPHFLIHTFQLRKSNRLFSCYQGAWKKRWFILRSGRMSGDPDKPIRVIDLQCCEQVDAGLTFNRKEFQDSFVFDIKTSDRTFYLVAETEDEMNKWVRSICQICGFNQSEENHDAVRSVTTLSHGPRSMPADMMASPVSHFGERKSSAPSHSSQPVLFTFETPIRHSQPSLSSSAPQDYLFLHQCISRKNENSRSASFSQTTRSSLMTGSDSAVQKLSHGVNGMGPQLQGFYSLPKPSKHQNSSTAEQQPYGVYDFPRTFVSEGHVRGSLPELELEDEELYSFKTPGNVLAKQQNERPNDNYDLPTTPGSFYKIPNMFPFDKNHNTLSVGSGDSSGTPPPRPPKPSQISEQKWGSPPSFVTQNGESSSGTTISRRNTLPAVENIRLLRGNSRSYESLVSTVGSETWSKEPRRMSPVARSDSGDSEDNYVPMNPGSSSSPFNASSDNPNNVYIPMSPGPHHFDFPGFSATLPARKGSTTSLCLRPGRLSDITPPPVNRNLKPDRKSKPTPLDLRNSSVIDELPFKSPVTKSWSRPIPATNSMSSQHCRPVSTQSITSTDSADSEDNYVAMRNPASSSPATSGTNSPALRKGGNVDYLALDFHPSSPGPHRKPSTSSVTSDEKVDYVQVDKEKTQALQNTMLEWTDNRQSSEPTKAVKS